MTLYSLILFHTNIPKKRYKAVLLILSGVAGLLFGSLLYYKTFFMLDATKKVLPPRIRPIKLVNSAQKYLKLVNFNNPLVNRFIGGIVIGFYAFNLLNSQHQIKVMLKEYNDTLADIKEILLEENGLKKS